MAWSKVITLLTIKTTARINDARPHPHILKTVTILARSFIGRVPGE